MASTNIAGVELMVSDLERSEGFYCRGLGLEVRAREDHEVFQEVQVIGAGDTVALLLVSASQPGAPETSAPSRTKVALLTDDLQAVYARALAEGGEEALAPQYHEASKVWFASLRDPDGHVVQLIEHAGPTT
jgi:catechol 2,3-dioxygenase-like lactoylglutathione lyase family enzyme